MGQVGGAIWRRGLRRPQNRFYRASLGPWFMEVKYLGVAYSRDALFVLRE